MSDSISLQNYILAVITTRKDRVIGGTAVFYCDDAEEMNKYAKNLEAILDGIAHGIGDDLFLIVKHF
ncbi:hypothetical protein ACH95_07320 [Bacillus glycinifermentans]|uniref:capping complex subunit for YIEGIA n=1 Tax=Bacillus glycinifermentans TaxID=1664069 RepID=UPI0006529D00|nr:hypothetical protein [Bacillus glycinifermentans]KMM61385.1 hypothetical protein ACH95_07320 [Bacillus glycinifermentans]MEC0494646.1 hypothetical protein [Bacillus glycinifermentans]MEC0541210.1 hypothetical protein [Bacillus glycinifermentans]MEC3608989.1 hypothetical protein [Bacillus glycinifermentans]UOY89604.1 hypothetical protein MW696_05055 [Bacillus glycinifermentans]